MQKKDVRAAEYRRLALQASVLADASTLGNVREKHEVAAARWAALAALDEAPDQGPPPGALPSRLDSRNPKDL